MTVALSKPPEASDTDLSWCTNPLVAWLITEGWNINDPAELVDQLARQLVAAGLPLWRLVCLIRTLHPQLIGTKYMWRRDSDVAHLKYKAYSLPHDVLRTAEYLESPFAAILDGGTAQIRRQLDTSDAKFEFPILEELCREGATDYVALPLVFSDGQINVISFTADRPGGFSSGELRELNQMRPVLARLLETPTMRRTAKTLLNTYLGKHTGERVLNGLIKRGDGEDIHAVIWFCDLRDSTRLADAMPPQGFSCHSQRFLRLPGRRGSGARG